MTLWTKQIAACVSGYATGLHAAVGPKHHVASPLGAWLLLASACAVASASFRRTVSLVGQLRLADECPADMDGCIRRGSLAWQRARCGCYLSCLRRRCGGREVGPAARVRRPSGRD